MPRIIVSIIFCAIIIHVQVCHAAEEARSSRRPVAVTPSLSLTPTAGMFIFDGHSNLKSSPVYGLRLGYDMIGKNFVDSLGIEGGLELANTQFKTDSTAANVYLMHAEALYALTPKARLVPSFVVGAGGMFVQGDKTSYTSGFFDYGASIKYFLKDYLAVRADLRHIFVYKDVAARSNFEGTIGLSFSLTRDKNLRRVPAVDADGDGVADDLDKCPNTPKGVKVDKDGCPVDSDGDGVPDYLDKCPNTRKGVKVDREGCPFDSDGDGVPDISDICPETPLGVKVDKDGCPDKNTISVAEVDSTVKKEAPAPPPAQEKVESPGKKVTLLDSDGDGVPDYLDNCPDTPKGVAVDKDGCPMTATEGAAAPKVQVPVAPVQPKLTPPEPGPATPEPVPVEEPPKQEIARKKTSSAGYFTTITDKCPPTPEQRLEYGEKALMTLVINFKIDKADIHPKYLKKIAEITEYLKKNPGVYAHVEGHADYTGPFDYNVTLSRVRAVNIKNQIIRNNTIDPERISINAYGCTVPIADNRTAEGRSKNRRGVIVITLMASNPTLVK